MKPLDPAAYLELSEFFGQNFGSRILLGDSLDKRVQHRLSCRRIIHM